MALAVHEAEVTEERERRFEVVEGQAVGQTAVGEFEAEPRLGSGRCLLPQPSVMPAHE